MVSRNGPWISFFCGLMLAGAANLHALPLNVSVTTIGTNRLVLFDLTATQRHLPGGSRFADVAERPQYYLEMLKEDLRNGTLDRLSLVAPRLADAMPRNAEALALSSIHLAATGRPLAARERCDEAVKRAAGLPLVMCAEAMVLREEGKLAEGARLCREAIHADPTHPYPWNILGRIQWQQGVATNALTSFQRAIQLNERFTPGYNNVGAVACALGDYPLARQAYHRAIELDPADTGAHYGLALVLQATGKPLDAIRELKTGLQHAPGHILSLQVLADLQLLLGQLDEALQTGQRLIARGERNGWLIQADACLQKGDLDKALQSVTNAPPNEPNRHYLYGYSQMAKSRYTEALQSMERAVILDPNHFGAVVARAALKFHEGREFDPAIELTNRWSPEMGRLLHYLAGSLRGADGDWGGALKELRQADDLVPGFSVTGLDVEAISTDISPDQVKDTVIGLLFHLKNMPDQALASFGRGRSGDTVNPLVSYWEGAAHLKQGDREGALACFDRATQKAPRFFSALYAAGELKFMAGKPDEAADYYRRAEAVKEDAGLSLRLGVYYDHAGEPGKAEQEYRSVVRLAPAFFAGYNQLAWHLLTHDKNLDEALALAQKADALQPGNGSVLDTIGWIYYQKGELDQALIHLKRAASINRTDPVILYHLGAAQFALNNMADAKAALTQSLELSDRSEVASKAQQLLKAIH